MRILLPTDFSETSVNAIEYALRMFPSTDNAFILLNMYQSPHAGATNVLSLNELLKEASEKHLNELRNELIAKELVQDANIRTESRFGSVAHGIQEMLVKEDIDLVSMGTKGETGLERLLLGSNAAYAVKYLDIPLLVIPKNAVFREPKKVLFAKDGEVEYAELNALREIHAVWDAQVRVLKVSDVSSDAEKEGTLTDIPVTWIEKKHADIIECIEEDIRVNNADVAVVIRQHHGLLHNIFNRSVSQMLASRTPVPLLVLRQ